MAHALFNYNGPCQHIHGHTYVLQVTVIGIPQRDPARNDCGMVVDFTQLKAIVREQIIHPFDHSLVLNHALPESWKKGVKEVTGKIHWVAYQPTCENLLLYFQQQLEEALRRESLELKALKLYETPSSWAEWYREDQ